MTCCSGWEVAAAVALGLLTLGCTGSQAQEKQQKDNEGVVTTPSGLKYKDIQEGSGKEAKEGSLVDVHYTGWLKDGTKFDSSIGKKPFTFRLGAGHVIKGWEEGVAGMKEGGTRKLLIPPSLGYGERGAGGVIPPNADLVFEVQLLKVH